MQKIQDVEFLKTLFSRFCHRRASTIDDINALGRLWIEVRDTPDAPMLISICDSVGSVLDIKWRPDVAWPARRLPINDGIADCDQQQLGRFVRRFLLSHGCINRHGYSTFRGVA